MSEKLNASKKSILIFVTAAFGLIMFAFISANAQQTFEEFKNQQEQEYSRYLQQEQEAFQEFVEDVERKWNEFKNTTRREWIEYSNDLNTLSQVNFEEGDITIETLVEKESENVMDLAMTNISTQIENLFQADSLCGEVILADLVEFNSPPIIDSTNVRSFVEQKVLTNAVLDKETIMSQDGIERLKVTVTFEMVPDHIKRRAEKYFAAAKRYSAKYKLELPLIMAIMQTESFFNPRAKSPIPAYGLMQLVPRSGAREAYRYAHKEDKIVKPDYLYTPENNIHLGCAYLAKMRQYEFKDIKDPDKLRYCLVAAYNTGPGNVCQAIVGEKKLRPAIEEIKYMDKETLYKILLEDLPYSETKDYLVKVETRREYYLNW